MKKTNYLIFIWLIFSSIAGAEQRRVREIQGIYKGNTESERSNAKNCLCECLRGSDKVAYCQSHGQHTRVNPVHPAPMCDTKITLPIPEGQNNCEGLKAPITVSYLEASECEGYNSDNFVSNSPEGGHLRCVPEK